MTLDDPSAWLSLERLQQRHYEEFVLGCRAFEQGWDGGAAEAPAVLLRRLVIAMVYARYREATAISSRGGMPAKPWPPNYCTEQVLSLELGENRQQT